MKTISYVVKTTVNGHSHKRIWDIENEFKIGFPVKWHLICTGSKISLIEYHTKKVVKSFNSKEPSQSVHFEVSDKERSLSYSIELEKTQVLEPAFLSHNSEGENLQIYHSVGLWSDKVQTFISGKYYGRAAGKKVFTLFKKNNGEHTSYRVKSYADDVHVKLSGEKDVVLKKRQKRDFSDKNIFSLNIRYQQDSWTFSKSDKASILPFQKVDQTIINPETALFHKSLKLASIIVAVILMISFFVSQFTSEKKVEPQVTTILLPSLMTSAPKGDHKARDTSIGKTGSNKNSGKKGSVVKVNEKKSLAPKVVKNITKKQKSISKQSSRISQKNSKRAEVQKRKIKQGPSRLEKAAQGLFSGGAQALLAQSQFGSGSDIKEQGKNLVRGKSRGSSLSGGAGQIGQTGGSAMNAGKGSVSGFGDGGPGSLGAGYGRGSHAKVSGQGRSFVSLDTSASDVEEGLTKDQVGRVIHSHMSEIRYCYESSTIRNPNLGGRLNVQFKINPRGRVKNGTIAHSTVGDSRLNSCIVSRLSRWQFPLPKGGVEVAVTYPFIFKTL